MNRPDILDQFQPVFVRRRQETIICQHEIGLGPHDARERLGRVLRLTARRHIRLVIDQGGKPWSRHW